ncbi:hypothetical protein MAR_003408, partial [Mya arenaria]
ILKEHNILNKSQCHLWNKGNDDGSTYTILDKSQQELWTEENGGGYTSAEGVNPRQDIELDRPKDTQANAISGMILNGSFCGIVGNATLYFDDDGVRVLHVDSKKYVKIPYKVIRRYENASMNDANKNAVLNRAPEDLGFC